MRVNLCQNLGVQFRVLSDDQCEQIVLAAFEVLERVGALFHEPEAVDILQRAGGMVCEGNRVRFPAGLIQQALPSAPRRFTLFTRPVRTDSSGRARLVLAGTGKEFNTLFQITVNIISKMKFK